MEPLNKSGTVCTVHFSESIVLSISCELSVFLCPIIVCFLLKIFVLFTRTPITTRKLL